MTLWKRERIWGGRRKDFTVRIRGLQHLVQWRGPPSDLGDKDEEHKGSDFLKELLTTWIGRGGPGQHLANQTGSLGDPLRQCKNDGSLASCQLLRQQHFAGIFTSEAVKRKAISNLACTCKIAKEERQGMFRSPATARPPIRSTRRGRERFLVWILSYCYNILSFSRTHNFGREFVHIMCLRSWFFFTRHLTQWSRWSSTAAALQIELNYSNKTSAVLSLSFNVHFLHPIEQFDLLAVVELQTSAFSFPSRGAGGWKCNQLLLISCWVVWVISNL